MGHQRQTAAPTLSSRWGSLQELSDLRPPLTNSTANAGATRLRNGALPAERGCGLRRPRDGWGLSDAFDGPHISAYIAVAVVSGTAAPAHARKMSPYRAAVSALGVALFCVLLFALTRHRPSPAVVPVPGELRPLIDHAVDRLQVVYSRHGQLYAIEDHDIFVSSDSGRTFQRIGQLPKPPGAPPLEHVRNLLARHRLVRRYRRNPGPSNIVVLETGTVIIFWDRIYRLAGTSYTFHDYPAGIFEPFPSSVGVAVGPGDTIYFGEYNAATPRPHPIAIVQGTEDGTVWRVVHKFPSGQVFHVHSISFDPYRKGYWVATGDSGDEVGLLFTADAFQTLDVLGCCAQKWRIVDLIVTEDYLFWGSDDDQEQPAIFRYDFATERLERLVDIDNPSYHAAVTVDGLLAITTTYEPRSHYTRRKDPPAATALWLSTDGSNWSRTLSLAGDSAAITRGARPLLRLPSGDPLPVLFLTPRHTADYDMTPLRVAPGWMAPSVQPASAGVAPPGLEAYR
jgi:hypothetical protein